jgi:hypothetical protein
MIDTRNQWLTELTRLSAFIRALNLSTGKDFVYVDRSSGKPVFHDADAYNLSNSPPTTRLLLMRLRSCRGGRQKKQFAIYSANSLSGKPMARSAS